MTPIKIKIIFKGISLCYHKEGQWRVILPFDDKHRLLYSLQKNGVEQIIPSISLAGKRRLSLGATNAQVPTAPARVDFAESLDITAPYAHRNGIKLKPDWNDKSVFMTVSDAVFFVEELTEDEYFIVFAGEQFGADLGNVGMTSGAEIIMETGGQLTLTENGENVVPPIDYEEAASYVLLIDNECPPDSPSLENDFNMFYDIIEDAADPQKKAAVFGKIRPQALLLNPGILPSRFPRGSICNFVSVSKIENLPV